MGDKQIREQIGKRKKKEKKEKKKKDLLSLSTLLDNTHARPFRGVSSSVRTSGAAVIKLATNGHFQHLFVAAPRLPEFLCDVKPSVSQV